MPTWKTLPQATPADTEEVWVRLNYWFGAPFLATWMEVDQQFKSTTPIPIIYPAWTISRWKSQ